MADGLASPIPQEMFGGRLIGVDVGFRAGGDPPLVAFCWAAVGIPLAFGIWKTREEALILFS